MGRWVEGQRKGRGRPEEGQKKGKGGAEEGQRKARGRPEEGQRKGRGGAEEGQRKGRGRAEEGQRKGRGRADLVRSWECLVAKCCKMLLWPKERLIFVNKCCFGLHSGRVPVQFVHHSNIISTFSENPTIKHTASRQIRFFVGFSLKVSCGGRGCRELGYRSSSILISGLCQSGSNTAFSPSSRGSGRIKNACGGITGRSPMFRYHPSGRATRRNAWTSSRRGGLRR